MPSAERLIEIYHAANCIADGTERRRFVEEACGNDPELQHQVLSLLEANEAAGEFLKKSVSPIDPLTEKLGDTVGRYKLLEKLGEGGCGVVYLAEQTEPLRRRVALKVIKLGMDTKQVMARFEAERQALAMMDHVNIAKILDAGATETGRPYFVMELVRGLKITDYCDQNHLGTNERLDLFTKVCQAIQHAHQKGVIHRDIKPSNILVTLHDGVALPHVIDFGIAKATEGKLTDATVYTQHLHFVGTPAYMSPEQAEVSASDVDTRSDIYSLGVLLYELLTGVTPFDGQKLLASGLDQMRKTIREKEPPLPSTRLNEKLPGSDLRRPISRSAIHNDLDWIVMKCLEKDRNRRYETANGLVADLKRHLTNQPVLARPPSPLYQFRKAVLRNKLIFATGGAVTLVMLTAVVILSATLKRVSIERNLKDIALREKGTALQEKGAALKEAQGSAATAKEQLFLALLSQARASRFSGRIGQRLGSLQALTEAAHIRVDERLRDEAIAAMTLPDISLGPSQPIEPLIAVDGSYRLMAKVNAQGIIQIKRLADQRELIRIASGHRGDQLMFSPGSRFLSQIDQDRTLRIWNVTDGQSLLLEVKRCSDVVFSQDEEHIWAAQEDSILHFALPTGREIRRWPVQGRVHSLALHPDGQRIAVGYEKSLPTSIYDLAQGDPVSALPVGDMEEQVVAWHPDGSRLAVGGTDPRIQIWDVSATIRLATLEGDVQRITSLTFHPDGELLASKGWDGVCRLWHPSSGRQLMQIPYGVWPFTFSKDGRLLGCVHQGANGQLVQIAACPEYRTVSNLGAGRGEFQDGDISPDGRILALAMAEGVRLWDLSNLNELAFLPIGPSYSAIFQPDGGELLASASSGVYRWPISRSSDRPTAPLKLGAPLRMPFPFVPARADRSRDGRTLAVVSEQTGGALLLDLTSGAIPAALKPHERAGQVAVSPNGKWLATAGWHSDRVRLWNMINGEKVHERVWIPDSIGLVSFTPDSRALVVSRIEEFTFLDVESFEEIRHWTCEVPVYPNQFAFSPDGALMALELFPGIIHLKEISTGRTIAKLEDPNADHACWMQFTPAGDRLVIASQGSKSIHIWDLSDIRVRLKEMGLDWDWPEFPKRAPSHAVRYPKERLRIEVTTIAP